MLNKELKIQVKNKKELVEIQELCFSVDVTWIHSKDLRTTPFTHLYIDHINFLSGSVGDYEYFRLHDHEEITLKKLRKLIKKRLKELSKSLTASNTEDVQLIRNQFETWYFPRLKEAQYNTNKRNSDGKYSNRDIEEAWICYKTGYEIGKVI